MGYREIPAISGFGLQARSRREGAISRGRGGNVRKSAITMREWCEWPRNQATRFDGQRHRFFTGYREIPAIAGFCFRTHSRRNGGLIGRASDMCEKEAMAARMAQNQAAWVDGQSLRIIRKYREIQAIAGLGLRALYR